MKSASKDRIYFYHKKQQIRSLRIRLIVLIPAVILLALFLNNYLYFGVHLNDEAMEPTLPKGNSYFFKALRIRKKNPLKAGAQKYHGSDYSFQRGDIIAFSPAENTEPSLFMRLLQLPLIALTFGIYTPSSQKRVVRRIIALPGENIRINEKKIFINHKPYLPTWQINYQDRRTLPMAISERDNIGETFVPTESVYVLNDNWDMLHDSRQYGVVPFHTIKGLLAK